MRNDTRRAGRQAPTGQHRDPTSAVLTIGVVLALLMAAACSGADDASAPQAGPAATTADTTTEGTGAAPTSQDELADLATEGFVLGYPLVVSQRTMQRFGAAIGVNQPFTQRSISDHTSRVVVSPNTDTLYAIAVLDLRAGPLLLHVPDITDRYHTFQLLDPWTESFAYLGTRTTGGRNGTYLLTPPGWDGEAPDDVTALVAPSPQAFLLGRVLVDGPDDVGAVMALTSTVRIEPLDPDAEPPPELGDAAGAPAVTGTDGLGFWDELGDALAINPATTPAQRDLVDRLAAVGVGPGRHPSSEIDDPDVLAALEAGIERGLDEIAGKAQERSPDGGWSGRTDLGTYGDDLLLRAAVAKVGWGANIAEEALYLTAKVDADGAPLDGATGYRIRFAPGEAPPTDAFWSITVYGADHFLVENELGRHALGDRSPGLEGEDGSLEVIISAAPPPDDEARWIPAPAGQIHLMLRLYLPEESAIDGTWRPPAIEPLG